MTVIGDPLASKLAGVLTTALGTGAGNLKIDNLRALTGGASRTTWAFDAVTDEQRRALILRTGAPDDVHAGMELEARSQAAAAAAGAPVPHILIADDSPAALGNPFLVCDAADRAMQTCGGMGYTRHMPFEHIYRHHRRYRITEGSEEIQLRKVAQALFS